MKRRFIMYLSQREAQSSRARALRVWRDRPAAYTMLHCKLGDPPSSRPNELLRYKLRHKKPSANISSPRRTSIAKVLPAHATMLPLQKGHNATPVLETLACDHIRHRMQLLGDGADKSRSINRSISAPVLRANSMIKLGFS